MIRSKGPIEQTEVVSEAVSEVVVVANEALQGVWGGGYYYNKQHLVLRMAYLPHKQHSVIVVHVDAVL